MNQFIYKKTILVLQHRYKLCILLFYSCWLFLFWCVIKEKCVYPAGARLYVFFINSLHLLGWHWFIGPYRSLHRMHTTQSQIIFCHHGFGPVYPLVPFTHFHLATITLLSVSLSFCSSKCIKCIAGSYVTFSFISQLWMQSYGSWLFPSDWFHWARFSLLAGFPEPFFLHHSGQQGVSAMGQTLKVFSLIDFDLFCSPSWTCWLFLLVCRAFLAWYSPVHLFLPCLGVKFIKCSLWPRTLSLVLMFSSM